jgi:hypothetical protein
MIGLKRNDRRWSSSPVRRRTGRRYFFTSLFVLIVGLAMSLFLAYWPKLLINEFIVVGTRVVPAASIIAAAGDYLDGQYFGFWPKRHIWWYPRSGLMVHLNTNFPRLAAISATAAPGRLVITVEERQPALLYCSPERCFFIDEEGLAYAPAPHFSPGVFLEWQTDESLTFEPPQSLTTRAAVDRLLKSQRIFEQVLSLQELAGWRISRLSVTADHDVIFWVDPVFKNDQRNAWQIIIDAETPPLLLADNLHTALTALLAETATADWPPLQYVDLRFGKKVFYKL